jgi:predicted flap endonuclease-1-like 5' DNA nuclease
MPVILATQETEIRKTEVQNQLRQIVPLGPNLEKTLHKTGLVK